MEAIVEVAFTNGLGSDAFKEAFALQSVALALQAKADVA